MNPPGPIRLNHMRTYLLLPGAGGDPWFWHRVVPLLQDAGHRAIAVDLPGPDDTAGLAEYREIAVAAMRGHDDVVVVAQSMGGFTAPLVGTEPAVHGIVLLNAMVPAPGERPAEWWDATGSEEARVAAARAGGYDVEFDVEVYFTHDLPPDLVAASLTRGRPESDAAFESACAFDHWPDVPTTVLAGRDDRFFPVDFQRRVARERLGIEAEVVPGGHLLALSRPHELVERLLSND